MSWRMPASWTRSTSSLPEAELHRDQLRVAPHHLGVLGRVHRAGQADQAGHAALRRALLAVAVAAQDLRGLRAVDDRAVAPELLRGVERLVGRLQQRRRGRAVRRVRRDAERDREREDVRGEVLPDLRPDPLGQHVALVLVGLRQHERELLAAHAADAVDAAHARGQCLAQQLERSVPRLMAEPVVQHLEPVEVADQDGQRRLEPARALDLELEGLLEAAPVEQTRQRIGANGVGQPVDQAVEPLLEQAEERGGHDERAEGDRPLGRGVLDRHGELADRVARHVVRDEHPRVTEAHEQDVARRLGGAEEVERVEGRPDVEERVRAGALAAVEDHPADEQGESEEESLEAPHREAVVAADEQGDHRVGGADHRQHGPRVDAPRDREEEPDQRERGAGAEEVGARAGHRRRIIDLDPRPRAGSSSADASRTCAKAWPASP